MDRQPADPLDHTPIEVTDSALGAVVSRPEDAARIPAPPSPAAVLRRTSLGLLVTMRPRQWVKNLLVLAAPAAAGVLHRPAILRAALAAAVAFCLASSSTYLLNDLVDRWADRAHPVKRLRPIAAGIVPVPLAAGAAAVLAVIAAGLAMIAGGVALTAVVGGYLALTLAYTYRLKHLPIADVAAISTGFVLRGAGGAVATGVPMSDWFIIVVSFGALFMAVGKRFSELRNLEQQSERTRATLGAYTAAFLRHLLFSAATVAIVSYGLWAFDRTSIFSGPWLALSIAPFALTLFNYALLVERGDAESPEDVVLGDRVTQILGICWAVLFVLGVYTA